MEISVTASTCAIQYPNASSETLTKDMKRPWPSTAGVCHAWMHHTCRVTPRLGLNCIFTILGESRCRRYTWEDRPEFETGQI